MHWISKQMTPLWLGLFLIVPPSFSLGETTEFLFPGIQIQTPQGFEPLLSEKHPAIAAAFASSDADNSVNIVPFRFLRFQAGQLMGVAEVMVVRSLQSKVYPLETFFPDDSLNKMSDSFFSPDINDSTDKLESSLIRYADCCQSRLAEKGKIDSVFLPVHKILKNAYFISSISVGETLDNEGCPLVDYNACSCASVWLKGHSFSLYIRSHTISLEEWSSIVQWTREQLTDWAAEIFEANRINPSITWDEEIDLQNSTIQKKHAISIASSPPKQSQGGNRSDAKKFNKDLSYYVGAFIAFFLMSLPVYYLGRYLLFSNSEEWKRRKVWKVVLASLVFLLSLAWLLESIYLSLKEMWG